MYSNAYMNPRLPGYVHGMSHTRVYRIWRSMKGRCNCSATGSYRFYGGRGIKVCEAWEKFEPFLEWSKTSGYRDDLSIERINSDVGYCPENCTWIPRSDQWRNKKNTRYLIVNGERRALADIAREAGLSRATLAARLKSGLSLSDATKFPAGPRFGIVRPAVK